MAEAAVRAHFDEPLDVERDFLAEVAFDGALFFKDRSDVAYFLFGEVANLLVEADVATVEDRFRAGTADPVNISKGDLDPLVRGVASMSAFCALPRSLCAALRSSRNRCLRSPSCTRPTEQRTTR